MDKSNLYRFTINFPFLRKANDIVACIYPVKVELHLSALYPPFLNNQFHFDLILHCHGAMPWYYTTSTFVIWGGFMQLAYLQDFAPMVTALS